MTSYEAERHILIYARRLIRAGWCQRAHMRDAAGAVTGDPAKAAKLCTVEAIEFAAVELAAPQTVRDEVLELFREAVGCVDIVAWNDAEGRTVEQVVNGFNRAARLARHRHPIAISCGMPFNDGPVS